MPHYSPNEAMWGSDPYLCTIGDCVHITDGVRFVTRDGGTLIFRDKFPTGRYCRLLLMGRYASSRNKYDYPARGDDRGQVRDRGRAGGISRNIPENSLAVGVPAGHQDGGRVPRQTVEELSWLRRAFRPWKKRCS